MDKPRLKKLKSGKWRCTWRDQSSIKPTPSAAYSLTVSKVVGYLVAYGKYLEERNQHDTKRYENTKDIQAKMIAEYVRNESTSIKFLKDEMTKLRERRDEWIVERICHYNQRHIDLIWKEKRLPNGSEYDELGKNQGVD